MINVKAIELDDTGRIVSMKGTFKKPKHFSYTTSKVYFWANFSLDYCGG